MSSRRWFRTSIREPGSASGRRQKRLDREDTLVHYRRIGAGSPRASRCFASETRRHGSIQASLNEGQAHFPDAIHYRANDWGKPMKGSLTGVAVAVLFFSLQVVARPADSPSSDKT